jgi:hypothetical protein
MYEFPRYYYWLSSFHQIVAPLLSFASPGIVTYRLARMMLFLLSSTVFAWTFWGWMRSILPPNSTALFTRKSYLVFVASAININYAAGYRTLSYNHLNDALLLFAGALTLKLISSTKNSDPLTWGRMFPVFCLGFVGGIDLFVKPTTGILLLGFTGGIILTWAKFVQKTRCWPLVLYMIGGAFLSLIVFFSCFSDSQLWIQNALLVALNPCSHSVSHLTTTMTQVIRTFLVWLVYIGPLAALSFLATWAYLVRGINGKGPGHRKQFGFTVLCFGLILWFAVAAAYLVKISQFWDVLVPYGALVFVEGCILLAILLVRVRQDLLPNRPVVLKSLLGVTLLAAMPFLGAVGSDVTLLLTIHYHITPWFALIIGFNDVIHRYVKCVALACILFIGPIAFSQVWFVRNYVLHPWELLAPLYRQTEEVRDIKRLKGIKVDVKTKMMLEKLVHVVQAKTDYKPGDPIIALYNEPTLVYLLEGLSPRTPSMQRGVYEKDCLFSVFLEGEETSLQNALIFASEDVTSDVVKCLAKVGIDFVGAYRLVETLDWPYHYADATRLSIYAPISKKAHRETDGARISR